MTKFSRSSALLPLALMLASPSLCQPLPLTDLLVVYQAFDPADETRLPELHALRLGADHSSGAPTPQVLVRDKALPLNAFDLMSDGSGGAYLAWVEMTPEGSSGEILLLRLDGQGKPVWPAPLALTSSPEDDTDPHLATDGQGGCLVAWNRTDAEYNTTAWLQRVNAAGARQWEAHLPGDAVISTYCETPVADGKGGAFLMATSIDPESAATCMFQHVGADGLFLWKDGARPLFGSGDPESMLWAFPDGAGGLMAVGSTMTFKDFNVSACTVLAQRMDAQGKPLWGGAQGVVRLVDVLGCALNPVALPDGKGGLCLAYQVSDPSVPASSDNLPDFDGMVQHLDATGQALWVDEPMLIFGSSRSEDPVGLYPLGDGGWLVLAEALDRHGVESCQVVGERLTSAGAAMWEKPDQPLPPLMVGQASRGDVLTVRRGNGVDLLLLEETYEGTHLLWTRVDDQGRTLPAGPQLLVAGPLSQRDLKAVALSGR